MLMVWTHGEEKQDEFIEYLNNIHTTIKFTSERSTMSNIPFVDVNEWNGYETRQTPLLYVFVDLKVHNVQKNSYHFDCIDQ